MALGAQRQSVVSMIVKDGMSVMFLGAAGGVALTLWTSRFPDERAVRCHTSRPRYPRNRSAGALKCVVRGRLHPSAAEQHPLIR